MPQLGEIRKGKEIGYKSHGDKYIWEDCEVCGTERWVRMSRQRCLCIPCGNRVYSKPTPRRGEHYFWRGGRRKSNGYILVLVEEDNPFYSMCSPHRVGYIFEHRLVLAQSLNRCLTSSEIVHHKNGDKTDNRLENLYLVSLDEHSIITILEEKIKRFEQRIAELESR